MAAEERASAISPERTELDEAVESIIERKEGAEEEMARRAERETAESVRKRSMERLAETREREKAR